MENKRNININRPKLTKEEIKQQKNFGNVMTSFQKLTRPFFKRPKFFRGLILVAAVATLVFIEIERHKKANEQSTEKPFVNPPLKDIDVLHEKYTINAEEGGELIHESGSKIQIPKNAFVDKEGKQVEGKIEIKYREFHDPVEVVMSGIPMDYDSAGTKYHFESAGMMEILAFKNSQPIFLGPNKKIQMEMISYREGSHYNLYELDTTVKNWIFKGKDKIKQIEKVIGDIKSLEQCDTVAAKKSIAALEKEIVILKKEIARAEDRKPVEPRKANTSRYKFDIAVDQQEFPALALYKGMNFEIGDENKNFNPKLATIIWEDAHLEKGIKAENYNLTLVKGEEAHTFIVYPVFEGKDFDLAKKEYDRKFSEYTDVLQNRKIEEKKKREEQEALKLRLESEQKQQQMEWARQQKQNEEEYARMNAEWENNMAEMKSRQEAEMKVAAERIDTQNKIYRCFAVSRLGTYNCDSPQNWPKGATLAASYINKEDKNKLIFENIILVDLKKNAYFTYYSYQFNNLKFDPDADNILIGVDNKRRLSLFRNEDFKKIDLRNREFTFAMEVYDNQFTNLDEIREIIKLPETRKKT